MNPYGQQSHPSHERPYQGTPRYGSDWNDWRRGGDDEDTRGYGRPTYGDRPETRQDWRARGPRGDWGDEGRGLGYESPWRPQHRESYRDEGPRGGRGHGRSQQGDWGYGDEDFQRQSYGRPQFRESHREEEGWQGAERAGRDSGRPYPDDPQYQRSYSDSYSDYGRQGGSQARDSYAAYGAQPYGGSRYGAGQRQGDEERPYARSQERGQRQRGGDQDRAGYGHWQFTGAPYGERQGQGREGEERERWQGKAGNGHSQSSGRGQAEWTIGSGTSRGERNFAPSPERQDVSEASRSRAGSSAQRGRHTGKGPKGYRRSDERITEDANQALERHGDIDASEIEVSCSNGVVTLKGTVEDKRAKRDAEDCVEDVYGVKDVSNQLRVESGHARSSSGSSTSSGQGPAKSASPQSGGSSTQVQTQKRAQDDDTSRSSTGKPGQKN